MKTILVFLVVISLGASAQGQSIDYARQLKNKPYISVKDAPYLAKGDGTEESTKFNSALAVGGEIFVPAGTYRVRNLLIAPNTTLTCARNTTLMMPDNYAYLTDDLIRGTTNLSALSNIHIRNCILDGNRSHGVVNGLGGGVVLRVSGWLNSSIENVLVQNAVLDGIYVAGWANAADIMRGDGTTSNPADGLRIINTQSTNSGRNNASIINAVNLSIVGGSFDHANGTAPQDGIDIEPNGPTESVTHFYINTNSHHNTGAGIQIQSNFIATALYGLVSGVYTDNAGGIGQDAPSNHIASNLTISGVTTANNGFDISTAGLKDSIITGFTTAATNVGVYLGANTTNTAVSDGLASGTTTDFIIEGASTGNRVSRVNALHNTWQIKDVSNIVNGLNGANPGAQLTSVVNGQGTVDTGGYYVGSNGGLNSGVRAGLRFGQFAGTTLTPTLAITSGLNNAGVDSKGNASIQTSNSGGTLTDAITIDGTQKVSFPSGLGSPLSVANGGTGNAGTAWTVTNPVPTSAAGSITTTSSVLRTEIIGKKAFVYLAALVTTAGTGSGSLIVTLPFTSAAQFESLSCIWASSGLLAQGLTFAAGTSAFNILSSTGTTVISNGSQVVCNGTMEIQ